jgi:hypothetical protein
MPGKGMKTHPHEAVQASAREIIPGRKRLQPNAFAVDDQLTRD